MSKKKGPLGIVISYVPLLTGIPGLTFEPTEETAKLIGQAMEELPSGAADACLWFMKEGKPVPVLVFEHMNEILDHLEWWSEGKIDEWFDLKFMRRHGKYCIAFAPRVQKSVERWKIAYQLRTGFPPESDMQFNIVFRSLHFVSGTNNTFNSIADKIGAETQIGFADLADINRENPGELDDEKIRTLGPFKFSHDKFFDDYLKRIVDEAKEPSTGFPFRR